MNKLIDDTKKFNNIYKRLFKKYFDKSLKEDGFYKKGTINFYRLNKLGMLEGLNFQKNYDELTVNYYVAPTWCASTTDAISLGGRLGKFVQTKDDYWWELKSEQEMEKNMFNMLEIIQTKLYDWFKKMENSEEVLELITQQYSMKIYSYITEATTIAKFKKYDKILFYTKKVKEEYENLKKQGFERYWLPPILEEALLLEEKLKEGYKAVDEYISEREKQSLRELGLEKLIKE